MKVLKCIKKCEEKRIISLMLGKKSEKRKMKENYKTNIKKKKPGMRKRNEVRK